MCALYECVGFMRVSKIIYSVCMMGALIALKRYGQSDSHHNYGRQDVFYRKTSGGADWKVENKQDPGFGYVYDNLTI